MEENSLPPHRDSTSTPLHLASDEVEGDLMLQLRRLRMLYEVGRVGSLAAAAEALAYTPTAVSQHIVALERETWMTLLERGRHGAGLTETGQWLAAHAEDILGRLARRRG
jgi:DNA-binding transcriptional LysR family regulator